MKIYIENFNGVLDALVEDTKVRGELTHTWVDADVLVLWQDVLGNMADIAQLARAQGKKVLVAEHGLLSINDYIPPLSKPLTGERFLAWGQRTKDWLTRAGKPAERIDVIGTFLRYKITKKTKGTGRITFAPRHWAGELKENIAIAEILRTLPYTVKSKIVWGEHNPEFYPNPIGTDRNAKGHIEECFNVLSSTDLVVGLGEGTFAALAYMMDIPVISVDIWEPKVLLGKLYTKADWDSQISDACYKPTIEELADTIGRVLTKDTMKTKRKHFREYALNWKADPLTEFRKVVENGQE